MPGDAQYDPTNAEHVDPDDEDSELNQMTLQDIDLIVRTWLQNGTIAVEQGSGRWRCDLAATGSNKHPQATIPVNLRGQLSVDSEDKQWKVQVHRVVWRYRSRLPLPAFDGEGALPISHTARDARYLELIAESVELNESRKYCHLFGWFAQGRCPHVYKPCTA